MGRSYAAASTTELQAAHAQDYAMCRTVVTAAPQLFPCDHHLCRSGKICPSGLAIALSASAVMKGVDAYDFLIGFRREKKENPMNKKGEL